MSRISQVIAMILLVASFGAVNSAYADRHPVYEPAAPGPFKADDNVFLNARVASSPHWDGKVPRLAVDGDRTSADAHWAAENIPVWLRIDLGHPRELNMIRLWTYWGDGRFYQYYIEASVDGVQWEVIADNRANTKPANAEPEYFSFETSEARYVRVTFTHNSASNKAGGHIVEIEGYRLPPEALSQLAEEQQQWQEMGDGLHGAVGSTDVRYARSAPPGELSAKTWQGTAWRGERVNAQFVLWTADGAEQLRVTPAPLHTQSGAKIPRSSIAAHFVRYVLADEQLVPDALDTLDRLDVKPETTRPVWVTIDVPPDAVPGTYEGVIRVQAAGGSELEFNVELTVQDRLLPPAEKWNFHLDLWQNPYSVARYHHVEPWSEAHMELLKPYLRMLADAGQKGATTTILHQPWHAQTYDPFETMVKWIRSEDGKWSFDYTDFDKCVRTCQQAGIDDTIHCFSMIPWTERTRYLDESTGDYEFLHFRPGEASFAEVWGPFLDSFVAHLRHRGWLDQTYIAMDERPPELMKPALKFLRERAPELKVALAGSNSPELKDDIDDWCVFISPPLDPEIARQRTQRETPTTFYVCCGPGRPNTFTFSPPAESAWLGWYAAAQDYTGFLRWAYNSWNERPLHDTSYGNWPAGDCYLVYPGPRSSIRFERLREGIQDYEKIRILKRELEGRGGETADKALQRLDELLDQFNYDSAAREPVAALVRDGRTLLAELSELPE